MKEIDMELAGKSVKAGIESLKKQPKVSLEQMLKQIQKSLHPGTKKNAKDAIRQS